MPLEEPPGRLPRKSTPQHSPVPTPPQTAGFAANMGQTGAGNGDANRTFTPNIESSVTRKSDAIRSNIVSKEPSATINRDTGPVQEAGTPQEERGGGGEKPEASNLMCKITFVSK